MLRFFLFVTLLAAPAETLLAQARLKCEVRPSSLDAMRHCYRPLLVFSPSATDARLKEQGKILDAAADDMMDRFVMLTPVLTDAKGYVTPLDTPYVVLNAHEMRAIRTRFGVAAATFEVLLLGEDGREKLRSDRPMDVTRLNRLIDAMPDRKVEMQRLHAN
jgi:hypothetical protein